MKKIKNAYITGNTQSAVYPDRFEFRKYFAGDKMAVVLEVPQALFHLFIRIQAVG
jgi:hypothetical protein